jgi:hypothetical protein
MFEGINYDRIYICGSVIPACAIKSPLELLFIDQSREDGYMSDERLLNYFEEYYPSLAHIEHVGQSAEVYAEIENAVSDVDIIVHVIDDSEFDVYANRILKHIKTFLTHVAPNAMATLKRIETQVSYKYYLAIDGATIRIPGVEIFRVFEVHPIGAVSRFHVPAVRGIFDGRDVKVFPSMISFAMTGYLIDFRWVSCAKNAKDIILRYYLRGAQFICNESEMAELAVHVATSAHLSNVAMYFRPGYVRDINSPLYKPRLSGHTIWAKLAPYVTTRITQAHYNWVAMPDPMTTATPEDSFICGANVPEFAATRYNNGAIQPLCLYLIKAYAESLGRSSSWS